MSAKKVPDIPKQYHFIFEIVIQRIRAEVKKIAPFIEELGNELTFTSDDFYISIKKKKNEQKKEKI